MADQHDVDLDSIIDRLLEVRGSRPGKQVQLLESEIRYLCTKAREIFISQPILLELEAPIKVSILSALSVSCRDQQLTLDVFVPYRSAAIFMGNTTIYCVFLSMVAFPRKQTTCFLVTMWTEASNLLKRSACCLHIK